MRRNRGESTNPVATMVVRTIKGHGAVRLKADRPSPIRLLAELILALLQAPGILAHGGMIMGSQQVVAREAGVSLIAVVAVAVGEVAGCTLVPQVAVGAPPVASGSGR